MNDTPDIPDTNDAGAAPRRRRSRWRRNAALALLVLAPLLLRADDFKVSAARMIAVDHLFSIATWEVSNLPRKWVHMLNNLVPGHKPSREERLAIVDEYLQVVRRANKEERRIEGAERLRGFRGSVSGAAETDVSDDYLRELLRRKRQLQPEAEEAIEAELSAAAELAGLRSRFGFDGYPLGVEALWPPVDVRFVETPTLLVMSPRDEITLSGAIFLDADIEPFERDEIESRVFDETDYAAYVDDIAGLATFPNMVADRYTTRTVLRTAAHEWLHTYWFFHPLGQSFFESEEMATINETAATIAGNELGDVVFERMGGDLTENASRYEIDEDQDSHFKRFMRETRVEAERLLDEGEVEAAEEYMRKRQWDLRLRGYYVRKLNQAYFAFRGRYATGGASVSPIGDKMREIRSYIPSLGEFVNAVSPISDEAEFEALLNALRERNGIAPDNPPAATDDE